MLYLINLLASETSSGETNNGGNPWMSYILIGVLVLMLVLTFVFNSRQRKKQQKEAEEKMNAMKVGDKVKTIGLIVGTIVEMDNDNNTIVLATGKTGEENYITVDRMAVYQTLPSNLPDSDGDSDFTPADNASAENADNASAENADNAPAENADNAPAENAEEKNTENGIEADGSDDVKND